MNGSSATRHAVVIGGAGFIGSNWTHHLLSDSNSVVHVVDNLARPGVRHNLQWLVEQAAATGDARRLRVTIGDVRDQGLIEAVLRPATEIYHFAAQVAVTTSIEDPREDFHINLCGTFNVLEGARKSGNQPFLLFTSTNKVYGALEEASLKEAALRYEFGPEFPVTEECRLDFHSPYGCSKGAADQYVRDYGRIYGLPAVVFRMSCIAGARQFGNEDQGWVAHFLYSALRGRPVTIYGNGKQVRDVLSVADLVKAIECARTHSAVTGAEIYNIGGGPKNAVSLLEIIDEIASLTAKRLSYSLAPPRVADQLAYVTDFTKYRRATGWAPEYSVRQTLEQIYAWWQENRDVFASMGLEHAAGASASENARVAS